MRQLIILLLVFSFAQAFAQVAPNKYLLRFTDKAHTAYELAKPEEFLTQRALERRSRFGIAVDSTDLPIDQNYVQGVKNTGAKLIIQVKWINALLIETESSEVLDAIRNLSYVVDIDTVNKRVSAFKSIDKFALEQKSSEFKSGQGDEVYGNAFNQIDMINGIALHEAGFKGKGIVIGVLDAGFINTDIRTIFKSLWDNNQILGSRNFVNPSEDVFRYNSHGTSVLSIMGGQLPGLYLGSAPEADYWLLLTEETGSEALIEEYNWIAGAAFADSVGVDIINSSLGYTEFDNPIYDHAYSDLDGNTTEVTKAADLAAAKGILVVNSAGNSGNDPWKYIIAPADGDSVLAVGAVGPDGIITTFSSYGFDWASQVKPNIVGQGGSTALTSISTDEIITGNGTSYSSPLIAGMMACLWQSKPFATNIELIHAVEESASRFSNPDYQYGHGIPDFFAAQLSIAVTEKPNLDYHIRIQPNPVSNRLHIQWDQTSFNWLELLDMQGRILIKHELNNFETQVNLSLESYKNGIYFLRLSNEKQVITRKIIKI